jgi:hypothetical protein
MIRITGLKARFAVLALVVFAFVSFIILGPYNVTPGHLAHKIMPGEKAGHSNGVVLTGHAIAPKLGNATAKYAYHSLFVGTPRHRNQADQNLHRAELGRAAWKVLHTTFGRFPEQPTEEEQEALRSYVHLFQRLYPWYVSRHVA